MIPTGWTRERSCRSSKVNRPAPETIERRAVRVGGVCGTSFGTTCCPPPRCARRGNGLRGTSSSSPPHWVAKSGGVCEPVPNRLHPKTNLMVTLSALPSTVVTGAVDFTTRRARCVSSFGSHRVLAHNGVHALRRASDDARPIFRAEVLDGRFLQPQLFRRAAPVFFPFTLLDRGHGGLPSSDNRSD